MFKWMEIVSCIFLLQAELGLEVDPEADNDLSEESNEAGVVKDLAQAILLLGQSVDTKYLTQPLGEDIFFLTVPQQHFTLEGKLSSLVYHQIIK